MVFEDCVEHQHPRHAEYIGGDAGELDVRCLEKLEETITFGTAALDNLSSIPQQVPKLADRLWRHEATRNQTVTKQIGDPLTVLHVGFATRHVSNVTSIADDNLEGTLENCMNWFPIDARTLHADVSAALRQEPITQRQQVLGHRSESFHRLSGFLAGTSDQQARDDRRLMYTEPTASLHNGVHLRLLNGEASAAPLATQETAMRPSRCRVRQEVVPLPARGSLYHRGR